MRLSPSALTFGPRGALGTVTTDVLASVGIEVEVTSGNDWISVSTGVTRSMATVLVTAAAYTGSGTRTGTVKVTNSASSTNYASLVVTQYDGLRLDYILSTNPAVVSPSGGIAYDAITVLQGAFTTGAASADAEWIQDPRVVPGGTAQLPIWNLTFSFSGNPSAVVSRSGNITVSLVDSQYGGTVERVLKVIQNPGSSKPLIDRGCVPVWEDSLCDVSDGSGAVDFTMYVRRRNGDWEEAFDGTAYAPFEVNPDRIAERYLKGSQPFSEERAENFVTADTTAAEVALETSSKAWRWTAVDDWTFSAEARPSDGSVLSLPVNGKASPLMWCPRTVLSLSGSTFVCDTSWRTGDGQGLYDVADSCAGYALYYLNLQGGYDALLLEGNCVRSEKVKRTDSSRMRRNTSNGRGTEQVSAVRTVSWRLNTGWLTDAQCGRMENVFLSRDAWLHDLAAGIILPVQVTDSSFEWKVTAGSGKMKSYALNVTLAQDRTVR